jgi:hypothetical protein
MMHAPRTLPQQGLALLRALAGEVKTGSFVEIDPLFGSTTVALAQGRKIESSIHSFDTFKSPPWIEKKFGFDLSRQLYDKFTAEIDNLIVHEGTVPEVPQDGWKQEIGLLFNSSARAGTSLEEQHAFFGPHLRPDAIICGGGFVGRSDQLVGSIYGLAQSRGAKLYVFGQFWAYSETGGEHIEHAIHSVSPRLEGVKINAIHAGETTTSLAACWTWGVHKHEPLQGFDILASPPMDINITTFRKGKLVTSKEISEGPAILTDADSIVLGLPEDIGMQFCFLKDGRTSNSKIFPTGSVIDLSDKQITAVRLGCL